MRILFGFVAACFLVSQPMSAQEASLVDELFSAVLSDEKTKVEELISSGVNPSLMVIDGRPLIVMAATQSSPEMLELLVNKGANPNTIDADGYSAVMRALEFGRPDNAKMLKDLGATLSGVSDDGYTVRLLAERIGLKDFGPVYSSPFELKISKDEANDILLTASEAGDVEAARFALEQGAEVRAKAENGWTPLMLSALGGHLDVFEFLMANHALRRKNEMPYAVDGITVITAILVGKGGKEFEMLKGIQGISPLLLTSRTKEYRAIAVTLGYPPKISSLFPLAYKLLPALDNKLPFGLAPTTQVWKNVQRLLQSEGLYSGKIDGKPGPMTYRGLFAYHRPMIDVLRKNSILAGERAKGMGPPELYKGLAYGSVTLPLRSGSAKTAEFGGEFDTGSLHRPVLNGYGIGGSSMFTVYRYGKALSRIYGLEGAYILERREFNDNYPIMTFNSRIFNGWYSIGLYKDKTVYYMYLPDENWKYSRRAVFTIAESNKVMEIPEIHTERAN